jgi:sugar O-acyltransferase (sialic acid O-acetyltransferase NeuD family)
VNLVLFGAGGHALEVLDVVLKSETIYSSIKFCVSEPSGSQFVNYELISWKEFLNSSPGESLVHLAIGDSSARARLTKELELFGFSAHSVVSPLASVSQSAIVDLGCFVGDFAYIGPRVKLGKSVVINNSVTISHEGIVSDFVTVSPGARINGNVRLGEGVFVGSGAVIKNGDRENQIEVGNYSSIGAGSVVLNNVVSDSTVVGNPAKLISKRI